MVLAAAWLAWPDIHRIPRWLVGILGALLVAVIIRPRLLWILIPMAIALAILKPRVGKPPSKMDENGGK
jgi:hypothetical protein